MHTIGIRREDKTEQERRAPLAPEHVKKLVDTGLIRIKVESSVTRFFSDEAYTEAGADVVEELPPCDLVIGVKEIPLQRLQPGKPHLFFSHTIKGQSYNMPLLKEILDRRCTLMDYELVADEAGRRLIFFGVQAGQAGMVNSLWSLGQRWLVQGIMTPLSELRQARTYSSLDQAKEVISGIGNRLRAEGIPEKITPLTVGITGYGSVSEGTQEILDLLEPEEISPRALLELSRSGKLKDDRIYKVVFYEKDMFEPADPNRTFELQYYLDHPELYRSTFSRFLPHISLLVNAIFWTPDCPRIVTYEDIQQLYSGTTSPRLTTIGDITCDVNGSVECTAKATMPDNPVYTVNPASREVEDGFEGDGILMMAVDILPTEIPKESTEIFGEMLSPYLAQLASADYTRPVESLELPLPFRKAVIAHQGSLTPEFKYLEEYLPDN